MKKLPFLIAGFSLIALTACGSKDDDAIKASEPPDQLYNEARDEMRDHNYKDAVKAFEEVERQYPASEWASHAVIMSAFSSYQSQDYDSAIGTYERYVKLYPDNASTAYAYYMIALCYYEQISDVGRDQKITEKALQALREVVRRFPDSEYAHDAKIKEDLTIDHLAGKEMQVGRYYLKQSDYLAAVNRFRYVVENYQTTTHVPEALHRLVECYLKLGVPAEAKRYAAVLGYNYPNSVWYRDSYKLMTKVAGEQPQTADGKPVPQPPASTSWWNSIIP